MAVPRVRLSRPLHRTILAGHPWVYRDAIDGRLPAPGTEVAVVDGRGRVLGRGLSESGPIGVRMWTTRDEPVDAALLGRRLDAAIELRRRVVPRKTDAFRLVHGEGDRIPGVVVDMYGRFAVVALDGDAARLRRDFVLAALSPRLRALGVATVIARWGRREDRTLEVVSGAEPPEVLEVTERGMTLCVDLHRGQKTGLFLDQRTSRSQVRALARDRSVLDLYAYVGGFSVAAGRGGATKVTTVDIAPAAIELSRRAWEANGLPDTRHRALARDVPALLTELLAGPERFDLIIADPPSFAPSAATRDKALGAYEALHRSCLSLLAPGGLLLAASCSSHVDRAAFEGALSRAAASQGLVIQVIDRWAAPPDHPRLLGFDEGDYLVVTLVRVVH
jgi:23S rRNA (cytosine1962-C5)-methyltransferase